VIGAGIFKVNGHPASWVTSPGACNLPHVDPLVELLLTPPGWLADYHISRTSSGYGVACVGVWRKIVSYSGALKAVRFSTARVRTTRGRRNGTESTSGGAQSLLGYTGSMSDDGNESGAAIFKLRVRLSHFEFEAEGRRTEVMEAFEQICEKAAELRQPTSVSRQLDSESRPSSERLSTSGKELTPSEFLKLKRPDSGTERLIVLAYYLERFRNTKDFSQADLAKVADEAKLSTIHAQYFTYGIQQGFLRKTTKGRYAITLSGEDFVEAMRESAKAD